MGKTRDSCLRDVRQACTECSQAPSYICLQKANNKCWFVSRYVVTENLACGVTHIGSGMTRMGIYQNRGLWTRYSLRRAFFISMASEKRVCEGYASAARMHVAARYQDERRFARVSSVRLRPASESAVSGSLGPWPGTTMTEDKYLLHRIDGITFTATSLTPISIGSILPASSRRAKLNNSRATFNEGSKKSVFSKTPRRNRPNH